MSFFYLSLPFQTDFSRISLPCLLEYLPYRKSDWTSPSDHLRHPWLASHGFACVRADLRGSGESDGSLEDEYAEQELADGCEIIGETRNGCCTVLFLLLYMYYKHKNLISSSV